MTPTLNWLHVHPDADKLKKWLGIKSLSIELEPTRPDLPNWHSHLSHCDRKMIELIKHDSWWTSRSTVRKGNVLLLATPKYLSALSRP